MNHKCKVCGEEKDVADFRRERKDGPYEPWNLRMCKSCSRKEYLHRYRDEAQREQMKAGSRIWKKEHPEEHARLAREYRAKNKEKTKAQNKLNYAIRTGKIQRKPCETCGKSEKVHAHHITYKQEDWYNVRWLCFECHKQYHTEPDYLKA